MSHVLPLRALGLVVGAALAAQAPALALGNRPQEEPAKPSLKIVSPAADEVVSTNDVTVRFDLKGYETQPDGAHVHLILDDLPYQAVYKAGEPYVLKNMPEGSHTLRAFPSRHWHESLKNPEAFAWANFHVKRKGAGPQIDPTKPTLTYSRPKGTYRGEQAERVMMDFWLANATLSPDGYRVRYTLDGKAAELTEWKPLYFENLRAGKHTLTLELLDPSGKLADANFARTTREFVIER